MDNILVDDKSTDKNNTPEEITKNEDGSFVVGGKHFTNIDALIESKVHADKHISTLINEKRIVEQSLAEAKGLSSQAMNLNDKLDLLIEQGQNTSVFNELHNDPNEGNNMDPSKSVTSHTPDMAAAIEQAVSRAVQPLADKLNQYSEKERIEEFTVDAVEHYGSRSEVKKAVDTFKESTQMSGEEIQAMVLSNPTAVLGLLKSTVPKGNSAPQGKQIPGDVNVPGSGIPGGQRQGTDTTHKPQKGYKELYNILKRNPSAWTAEHQAMMNEGSEKLGSDYINT